MKKFSFLSATVLVSAITVVLFVACQKEQVATPEEQAVPASEGAVRGIAGGGPFSGSVNSSYAAALADNFNKKFGRDDDNMSQSVAFNAKDLIGFINNLQTKYKSDIIYINFGVYGKGAKPVNAKDWGRLTVFLTGNKIGSTGGRRNDGVNEEEESDQYLNHAQLFPPTGN